MNKLLAVILVGCFASVSGVTVAAPADEGPPAQQQKNQVPDSGQSGNYLETQQDNNGGKDVKSNKRGQQNAQPGGHIEKSKKVNEKPEDGGLGTHPNQ